MESFLLDNGFDAVVRVNGTHKTVTVRGSDGTCVYNMNTTGPTEEPDAPTLQQCELGSWLGEFYAAHHGHRRWAMAITGNICVQRGVTLHSPQCVLSHAIFPPSITKTVAKQRSNQYQLAARVCGNILPWLGNRSPPCIYCPERFMSDIRHSERFAVSIAQLASTSTSNATLTEVDAVALHEATARTSVSLHRRHRTFSKQADARVFSRLMLGHVFVYRPTNLATKSVQTNGHNPSCEELVYQSRGGGFNATCWARLVPIMEQKWCVYWDSRYVPKAYQAAHTCTSEYACTCAFH